MISEIEDNSVIGVKLYVTLEKNSVEIGVMLYVALEKNSAEISGCFPGEQFESDYSDAKVVDCIKRTCKKSDLNPDRVANLNLTVGNHNDNERSVLINGVLELFPNLMVLETVHLNYKFNDITALTNHTTLNYLIIESNGLIKEGDWKNITLPFTLEKLCVDRTDIGYHDIIHLAKERSLSSLLIYNIVPNLTQTGLVELFSNNTTLKNFTLENDLNLDLDVVQAILHNNTLCILEYINKESCGQYLTISSHLSKNIVNNDQRIQRERNCFVSFVYMLILQRFHRFKRLHLK